MDLSEETSLLGLPASRDYVLLANFFRLVFAAQRTITHAMAREMDIDAAMDSRFVELYMNGQYQGVYDLGTHVGVGDRRPFRKGMDCRAGRSHRGHASVLGEPGVRHSAEDQDLGEDIREKTAWKQIRQAVTGLEQALASPDFTYNGRRYTERIDLDSFAVNYLCRSFPKTGTFTTPTAPFSMSGTAFCTWAPCGTWTRDTATPPRNCTLPQTGWCSRCSGSSAWPRTPNFRRPCGKI